MLNPKSFNSDSTEYGFINESKARKEHENLYQCHIKKVGVVVSFNQPWLCSSFDGLVFVDGHFITKSVEFKCPSKCEKKVNADLKKKVSSVSWLEFIKVKLILNKVIFITHNAKFKCMLLA